LITVNFDGLCYPKNPGGVAAYGYIVRRDGDVIHRGCGAVGQGRGMTNNVAEYAGLLAAMEWLASEGIDEVLTVRGDSELVIRQMKGEWQVRSATSRHYVPQIRPLLSGREVRLEWVPREENEEADLLSRVAYERYIKKMRG